MMNSKLREEIDDAISLYVNRPLIAEERWNDLKDNLLALFERQLVEELEPMKARLKKLVDEYGNLELYKALYGELPRDYDGVDTLAAIRSYDEKAEFRENFERYLNQLKANKPREE